MYKKRCPVPVAYRHCDTTWLVSSGMVTANALELEKETCAKPIGRSDTGQIVVERQANSEGTKTRSRDQ